MDRRSFLMASSAGLAAPAVGWAATPNTLTAGPVSQQLLPEEYAGHTALLGFNGSVPGPEIRIKRGQTLDVRLLNLLDDDTAIHWHGIRLDNAMDGVPYLTQEPVPPGGQFDYSFVPPDAGTYWYHSHQQSQIQVARGLMGPLIVEEHEPADLDHDIVMLIADWRLDRDGQITNDFNNRHDMAHAGRMGNFVKAFLPNLNLRSGERIRLRVINAAVDRIIPLIIKGFEGQLVALDGMPLSAPRPFGDSVLAPAQRMDLIGDVTANLVFEMDHRMGPYPLGSLKVDGEVARRSTPIQALPANDIPKTGPVSRDLVLTMRGGAMGGAHGGADVWSFNDVSGMDDAPFAQVKRGDNVRIRLENQTRFPHGIHLHGHHFFELDDAGRLGDLRDTTLVQPQSHQVITCLFENPGRWMLHCHMLSHQAGGMKSWIEVV